MATDDLLLERIEEQLLQKFADEYPDGIDYTDIVDGLTVLNKDALVKVLSGWISFWANERPIIKDPMAKAAKVLEMKQVVCDIRIQKIKQYARAWNVM